jgi:4-hydroxybenzoyl-CoA reductase alpha subunit
MSEEFLLNPKASDMEPYAKKPEEFELVGTNYANVTAEAKVTGRAKYAGDFIFPGMLYAKFLRSPHAHARIVSVDTSEAEKLPGVKGIITGKDFPYGKLGCCEFADDENDKFPLQAEKVRLIGDEVACVAAVDEATAAAACKLIKVEYELLKTSFSPRESGAPDMPAIHKEGRHNLSMRCEMHGGDVNKAFAQADYTDKCHYSTQYVVHAAMEPHAAIAKYEDGEVTLWTATQAAYVSRFYVAATLGLPQSKVRVIQPAVGGGFGGKLDIFPHESCVCKLAMITGRPVRLVLTREEVFIATRTRHPIEFDIETAFKKDGTLLAKRCLHTLTGGGYSGTGTPATMLSMVWANLPYKLPNLDLCAMRFYTNTLVAGAQRGYTSCQVHFANDVHMDEVAEKLKIDPLEIRKINAVTQGYTGPTGLHVPSCSFMNTLNEAGKAIKWEERKGKLNKGEGIGFAGSGFLSGSGFGILETPKYTSSCNMVRLNREGYATIFTGSNDIGQGSDTVMTLIVAEELGLKMDEVNVVTSDTTLTPWDNGSFGSRVTYLAGNAARRAAVDAKRQLCEAVGKKLGVAPESLRMKDHRVYVGDKPEVGMSYADAIFTYEDQHDGKDIMGIGSYYHNMDKESFVSLQGNIAPSYSFSTSASSVKVDEETGVVDITDFIFAHDCGRALNVRAVEGQIEGSVQMGLGYTLFEEALLENGKMLNPSFRDYRFPTALDMPHMQSILCGEPDPEGTFGAKECGEGSTAPVAPAIVNAISKATGIHFNSLPLTPERIWRACKEKAAAK